VHLVSAYGLVNDVMVSVTAKIALTNITAVSLRLVCSVDYYTVSRTLRGKVNFLQYTTQRIRIIFFVL